MRTHPLKHRRHVPHIYLVALLYVASIFFSLHYALTLYLNSSFLERYFPVAGVSLLYVTVAIVSLFGTFSISHLYNRFSNYRVLVGSIIFLFFIILFLGGEPGALSVIFLFIAQQVLVNNIFISLNVALQEVSRRSESGSIHGVYFTILNLGVLGAAFLSGFIFNLGSYRGVYLASAMCLVPVFYIAYHYFHDIEEPHYKDVSFLESLATILKHKDVRRIMYIQFVLECFFAVMVVYMTPYLITSMGIPAPLILSFILPIALIPFVIFPYELGILADTKFGEKEFLIFGIIVATIFTTLIPFIQSSSFVVWAIVLLFTRIGASFIEAMAGTYFYKKVHKSQNGIVSLFVVGTRSLALIIIPTIAAVLFSVLDAPIYTIFFVVTLFMLSALLVARNIHDTL